MFLVHILIAVCTCACVLKYNCIIAVHTNEETKVKKKELEEELEDVQNKTPLIDIIFTDGSKRTCTGSIIHDYVVITAGHCFLPKAHSRVHPRNVEPELTGSFVVIGTKKKFDSGYEQYLPIERVITHPEMKGWSCDLALVHTFASMTGDQVGAIMPLAGEKTSTNIEPNVTILSWGRTVDVNEEDPQNDEPCCTGDKVCDSAELAKCEKLHHGVTLHDHEATGEDGSTIDDPKSTVLYKHRIQHRYPLRQGGNMENRTKVLSRYLSSGENAKHDRGEGRSRPRGVDEDEEQIVDKTFRRFIHDGEKPMDEHDQPKNPHPAPTSWRRQIGSKETNKLTLETFGFLNAATCKKMLQRAHPDMDMQGNEIVCYASDDHYVTEEDSGAPVVRLGQLIAITVGGIRSDGDHVAVGMKLSYFCPWINENLPAGDANLNCWAHSQNHLNNETASEDSTKRVKPRL